MKTEKSEGVVWRRVLPGLVMMGFTGAGVGEPLHEVTEVARWACNAAGFVLSAWVFTAIGRLD